MQQLRYFCINYNYRNQFDCQQIRNAISIDVNKLHKNYNNRSSSNSRETMICGCTRRIQGFSTIHNSIRNNHKKPDAELIDSILDHLTYERVCAETLDALNDYFEQLLDNLTDEDEDYLKQFQNCDISYSVSKFTSII